MASYEFIVHRRPLSLRSRDRAAVAQWKAEIRETAERAFGGHWFDAGARLRVVHFCRHAAMDTDNVIKPVQDALIGVAYADDRVVSDVSGHRRILGGPIFYAGLPELLRRAWRSERECVYVRIDDDQPVEDWR